FAALAALLVGAIGIPAQAQDNGVVIGYSAPGLVGAQAQIQQGLVDGAEAKGWTVITVTSGGDAQKQLNDINDFIAQGVDAIVAVPDDSAGACVGVEAAAAADIPFYTIDRSTSGCAVNMTVLSDNFLAGQQSGEAIVEFLTGRYGSPKGKVLEITGNLAQNVAQLRGGGFNAVMAANPDITVITKVGDWDSAKGADIVRDVATTEADLDAIYMHSDCAYGPSVVQTLAGVGKTAKAGEAGHIHLSGVDGCLVALDLIRAGSFDQSSNQPIPDFGKVLADYIELELGGGTIEAGEVVKDGALWSPARIEMSDVGPQMLLSTTSVGVANVDDPALWGNIEAAAAGMSPAP
ncbi:MAG: sugar ABC transporter substrate-binding protein, partial [Chloroflexi bacterium]|nr:sugar ABC transporter substrate-binding protein [Chloroflexota bacterium]